MKELVISKNDAGQRLDRFIAKAVPLLPISLIQKYIRTKRIKVGGKAAKRDYRLTEGETVSLYVNDEFFAQSRDNSRFKYANSEIDIIYEDDNILLINKHAGILCHNAGSEYSAAADTIINRVQAYLHKSGQWHPGDSHSFTPALCNRIDRNTSGIVIAAKNAEALRIICEKIKQGETDKYYLTIVHGKPRPQKAKLEGYIFKDSVKNRVYVQKKPSPGAKYAAMEYSTIDTNAMPLSLLECRLLTGRTHQIRAQLASAGNPILGDRKYGRGDLDKPYGETKQALCSYKLVFNFTTDAGCLNYLRGKIFKLKTVPFKEKYFG